MGTDIIQPELIGRIHCFRLPTTARGVRLVSRGAIPAHVREDSADHRRLGVAVSRFWLDGRQLSLESPRLEAGWHGREDGWRWTDGEASLAVEDVHVLHVEAAITERYWLEDDPRAEMHGRPGSFVSKHK